MEYKINFELIKKQKIEKIFYDVLTNNIYLLEKSCNYEEFLNTCIKNTLHVIQMKEKIGSAKKVKNDNEICVFCNEFMKPNELKRVLPCHHVFHKKCIDKWLFKYYATTCPCCMQNI